MPRWQLGVVALFFAVYVVVILLTGEPVWLIPGAILALIVIGWGVTNRAATKSLEERHGGDIERAMSDESEPLPSAHLLAVEDDRPAGDTPEAHDEINPRDIPPDSPARQAAEEQVAAEAGDGETRGNVEGAQGGPEPRDSTAERA
jgi:hypothetical protein